MGIEAKRIVNGIRASQRGVPGSKSNSELALRHRTGSWIETQRAHLFPDILRLSRVAKLRWIVGEPGLRSSVLYFTILTHVGISIAYAAVMHVLVIYAMKCLSNPRSPGLANQSPPNRVRVAGDVTCSACELPKRKVSLPWGLFLPAQTSPSSSPTLVVLLSLCCCSYIPFTFPYLASTAFHQRWTRRTSYLRPVHNAAVAFLTVRSVSAFQGWVLESCYIDLELV